MKQQHTSAPAILMYALGFTAIVSLGEMAYWTYTKEITRYRVLGFDYMWRIPLGYSMIFAVVAVIAWALRRYLKPATVLVHAGVFIVAAAWLPIVFKGLHRVARLALAAGLAVQLGRMAARYADMVHRAVRYTAWVGATLTVLLAAGFNLLPRYQEATRQANLPAPRGAPPNVLLIVLDTVRAKSLSLYGYSEDTTPNLTRFAAGGAVFNRAYATAPWTRPSHGSLFTGRFPHELSVGLNTPLDATHPTLAEVLSEQGYLTGGFVANSNAMGDHFGVARGFVHYEDEVVTPTTSLMNASFGNLLIAWSGAQKWLGTHENFGRKSAEAINQRFLEWLSSKPVERPFFAFLNYFDAHSTFLPPEPFASKFWPTRPEGDIEAKDPGDWSPEELRELTAAYHGAIAYLDHHLGELFTALEQRGALKDTLVIVTSDHGELFGEHGLVSHANSLYRPLLEVPLVVVFPGRVAAGQRIESPVSLRSVPATVVELIGLHDAQRFPGTRLLFRTGATAADTKPDVILAEVEHDREANVPKWFPSRRGHMKTVIVDDWQYIKNYGDGTEELFDLRKDPDSLRNLAATETERLEQYRGHLAAALGSSQK